MRTSSLCVYAFAIVSFFTPSIAEAADEGGESAPSETPPPDISRPAPVFRRFALEINPLAAIVGRYSFNVEIMTGRHGAFVMNPFFRSSNDLTPALSREANDVAAGSEFGLRYYSGVRGPNGFFVGPSVIIGTVRGRTPNIFSSPTFGSFSSFSSERQPLLGFAIDVGGQHVTPSGFIISGGGGWFWSNELRDRDLRTGAGFPRVLFAVGQAL